jgi:hypothetical protein
MSIDQLPPTDALARLREARSRVEATLAARGGAAPFDEIAAEMQREGFGAYDTRLALASAGATVNDAGELALRR